MGFGINKLWYITFITIQNPQSSLGTKAQSNGFRRPKSVLPVEFPLVLPPGVALDDGMSPWGGDVFDGFLYGKPW